MNQLAAIAFALILLVAPIASAATPLTTIRVASGLTRPIYVTYSPGDSERIYIAEQVGIVRVLRNGELLPDPYLNVNPLISYGGELGLLGFAFHPNFASNGYFYVDYTDDNGDTVVVRYHGDPDQADADSAKIILKVPQPYSNHKAGWIGFGPDGYLYIALGDGGDENDPQNRSQDTGELLGKLLRIDVNTDAFPDDTAKNYAVPASNPFVGTAGADEIWAFGLRNPWRPAFDRATGDLYIADVGQDAWEEIDFQSASSTGGENYGWRCMEGNTCTGLSGCTCNDPSLTMPIYAYVHDGTACAIMGGEVYRGSAISDLAGTYFFADYCSNRIFSFSGGPGLSNFKERTSELNPCHGEMPNQINLQSISSFGQDEAGEIYLCDLLGGEVFKIVPDEPLTVIATDPPDNAIDARAPQQLNGIDYSVWHSVDFMFDEAAACETKTHFAITKNGGSVATPTIQSVTIDSFSPSEVTANLSSPIESLTWVTVEYLPRNVMIRLGALPGDVDASEETSPIDILALIDGLNHPSLSLNLWSYDIDHSGSLDRADVNAELNLLRGIGTNRPYLGESLP